MEMPNFRKFHFPRVAYLITRRCFSAGLLSFAYFRHIKRIYLLFVKLENLDQTNALFTNIANYL